MQLNDSEDFATIQDTAGIADCLNYLFMWLSDGEAEVLTQRSADIAEKEKEKEKKEIEKNGTDKERKGKDNTLADDMRGIGNVKHIDESTEGDYIYICTIYISIIYSYSYFRSHESLLKCRNSLWRPDGRSRSRRARRQ